MATVKRIGPGSAFKIGLLYAAVGPLVGIVWALFSVLAGSLGSTASAGATGAARFLGFGMGVAAVIIFPICYGIFGGVAAVISAVLYNLPRSMLPDTPLPRGSSANLSVTGFIVSCAA